MKTLSPDKFFKQILLPVCLACDATFVELAELLPPAAEAWPDFVCATDSITTYDYIYK